MPHIRTVDELNLCLFSLESLRLQDLNKFHFTKISGDVVRLTVKLDTPVVLDGKEYQALPAIFYITTQIIEDGFSFKAWPDKPGDSAKNMVARFWLESRPDLIPRLEWHRITESLGKLAELAQKEMHREVTTKTLFSFNDEGSLHILINDHFTDTSASVGVSAPLYTPLQ